ncbi:MAG: iron chelate uptake ABC transporter family permease subunit [Anaerolineae bacterium]|nr:iron chelate uptake ABC transporter family permease subunit [Anaerolineae bacterium]
MSFNPASTHTQFLLANQPVHKRLAIIGAILAGLLALAFTFSIANGSSNIPYREVARTLLSAANLIDGSDIPDSQARIVLLVRLPRALVGALVGAALAIAGATMQGLFRNPLAEPGTIGVSAGSGLGAVIALTSGIAASSLWAVPLLAFVTGLGSALLVYILSLHNGRTNVSTLLLAGIAVNSFLGAATSTLLLMAAEYGEMQAILTWIVGGLRGRGMDHAALIVLPIIACSLLLYAFSRDLNLLLLGEETAQGLGINVPRTRFILLGLATLLTASAVSTAGGIGFVGLIVPHALRLIIGPDHRLLLPASALGGAIFLVVCDTFARLLIRPAEIQVGLITAMLGAPFFLFLLWRNRRQFSSL